jgi:hypothetical protein
VRNSAQAEFGQRPELPWDKALVKSRAARQPDESQEEDILMSRSRKFDEYAQATLLDCISGRLRPAKLRDVVARSSGMPAKSVPESSPSWLLVCTCRSFRFPHHPDRHKELSSEHDWRTPSERDDWRQTEKEHAEEDEQV